jgi:hypothetical protein
VLPFHMSWLLVLSRANRERPKTFTAFADSL